MKSDEVENEIEKISNSLQNLYEKDKNVGYILLAGITVSEDEIIYRVYGAGKHSLLTSMMWSASEKDKEYKQVFDEVLNAKIKVATESKLVPFSLQSMIKKVDYE